MPTTASLSGFIVAALVVLLIPGPGVLYIVTRSLSQGRRAGLVSVLGLSAGALVHVVAATAGLSAILLASATAFGAVKALGAGYLIYLGVRTLLSTGSSATDDATDVRSASRLFTDGVIVSVLNPKIAVFFLAFLPQFVAADSNQKPLAFLVLGLIFIFTGTLWCLGIAAFAARAASRIRQSAGAMAWVNRLLGGLFVYLGIRVAMLEGR
jgi:threonine/homoserine/homoserine lactone efflux protein